MKKPFNLEQMGYRCDESRGGEQVRIMSLPAGTERVLLSGLERCKSRTQSAVKPLIKCPITT